MRYYTKKHLNFQSHFLISNLFIKNIENVDLKGFNALKTPSVHTISNTEITLL